MPTSRTPTFRISARIVGTLFLLRNHNTTMTVEHIVIKIAAFAYEPCTITEEAALKNGFTNEDDYECDFCNDSWKGWTCQYCTKRH